jgi:heme A synthase
LLGAIDTPLKFYVLALLIVETFLGATLVGARLDAELQKTCVYLGVGMFVLVVGIVSFIVLVSEEPLTRKR